jgi:hypothetical protein
VPAVAEVVVGTLVVLVVTAAVELGRLDIELLAAQVS